MPTSVKVYKKSAPSGQLFLYLQKREFISCDGLIEDIHGVANLPDQAFLEGKLVYASLVCSFRYGREDDEVMGLSFQKEMVIDRVQIFPKNDEFDSHLTKLQNRLVQKMGDSSHAFTLRFPETAPNSVLIKGDEVDVGADMGVAYEVTLHVADSPEDFKGRSRKGSVSMTIRKSQWVPANDKQRSPTAMAEKRYFLSSKGNISLECALNKEIHYHGENVPVHVVIHNNSKKTVRSIQVAIIQHCELTMMQMNYRCKVCQTQTMDGCPLNPGTNLNKTFVLKPLWQNMDSYKRGLVLDAALSKVRDETNLASSSIAESGDDNDLLGVVVSYVAQVKLNLSGMGGELEVALPFKLVHPKPESEAAGILSVVKQKLSADLKRKNLKHWKLESKDSVESEKWKIEGSNDRTWSRDSVESEKGKPSRTLIELENMQGITVNEDGANFNNARNEESTKKVVEVTWEPRCKQSL